METTCIAIGVTSGINSLEWGVTKSCTSRPDTLGVGRMEFDAVHRACIIRSTFHSLEHSMLTLGSFLLSLSDFNDHDGLSPNALDIILVPDYSFLLMLGFLTPPCYNVCVSSTTLHFQQPAMLPTLNLTDTNGNRQAPTARPHVQHYTLHVLRTHQAVFQRGNQSYKVEEACDQQGDVVNVPAVVGHHL